MSEVVGLVNLHYSPSLGSLTARRPFGTVTFLGRYGIMDFTLSNFSNSGINDILILAKNYAYSIHSHIQNGQAWINNTKAGYIRTAINEKSINDPTFNTDIGNINANLEQIDLFNTQYFVIAPVHYLTSMDFRPIIDEHRRSGAAITMVYTRVDNSQGKFRNCTSIKLDKSRKIVRSATPHNSAPSIDVSLDTFIISKDTLLDLIKMQKSISTLLSVADLINYCINNHLLTVNAYRHTNRVFPIFSLHDYVDVSMQLLDHQTRMTLFLDWWPIYTPTNNTPPSLYGPKAEVSNSFIANGAIIKGKVTNSIISRDVTIEEGADVKDSIIFTRSLVGKDVKLSNAICDKDVKIKQVKELSGSEDEFLVIAKGVTV